MPSNRSPGEREDVVGQLAAVAGLGRFGLQEGDEEAVLREVVRTIAKALDVVDVALFEMLADRSALFGRAGLHSGQLIPANLLVKVRIPAGAGSLPGYAAAVGEAVVSDDIGADPRFQAVAPEFNLPVRGAIAAPISWGERLWGVLVTYCREERTWSDDEVQFVQSVANTAGLVVQRAKVEAELRNSSLGLDLSLAAGGLGAWSFDVERRAMTMNASAMAMLGLDPKAFGGTGPEFFALVHPDDRVPLREAFLADFARGRDQHHVFRVIRRSDGEVRWVEAWAQATARAGSARSLSGVVADITDRRRADAQREALLASEHAARIEAERARERMAFLAEVSAHLGSSLDPVAAGTVVTERCVPYLADVCFVDLIDDLGGLEEQAAQAVDRDSLAAARALRRRRARAPGEDPMASVRRVAIEGRAVLHRGLSDEQLQAMATDAEHLALLRRAGLRSAMIVPLRARDHVIGAVTLLRVTDRDPYDRDDLNLVEDLATRAALAIDNGRLYHSRNRVARSLQAALLPPALPVVAGLELAARYQVAEADVAIGGDFYDAIEVGEREWGVVVGDVCGRGPDAAALTGLVRHSVRTAVVRESLPSRVLAQTNAAVLDQIDDTKFCTAAYLRLTLAPAAAGVGVGVGLGSGAATLDTAVQLMAASAGHPSPAIVRAAGGAELLDCAGTLLGVVEEPVLVDVEATLGPGDAIVLYTDGVTEARHDGEQFGQDRLVEALAALAGSTAEEIAAGLMAAVDAFRSSASDDTAILVVRAAPASVASSRGDMVSAR